MKSAFTSSSSLNPITLEFSENGNPISFNIQGEEKPILKWIVSEKSAIEEGFPGAIASLLGDDSEDVKEIEIAFTKSEIDIKEFASIIKKLINTKDKESIERAVSVIVGRSTISEIYKDSFYNDLLANFIIYSPEISSLRKFDEEGQIKPLGIKGEGLFNLLQIFSEDESYGPETIREIKNYLQIIEWFDDFNASVETHRGIKVLAIKDMFVPHISLTQNNVNEGFLFLLFYISLIISKETPSFFAIDNIEASFHPKLCEELMRKLIELSERHNKQIILTTQNPFVLDGLNLDQGNQSLFVVRRNSEGETIADKIEQQPKNVKLSEAWMRGYIGGQPETIE